MSETTWNDPRITAYALGELSGDEKNHFEQELNADAELGQAVGEASQIAAQLREHYAAESTPPADAERRSALLAAAAASSASDAVAVSSPTTPPPSSWWRTQGIPLAIAASLIGVLCVLTFPSFRAVRDVALQSHPRPADQGPVTASPAVRAEATPESDFDGGVPAAPSRAEPAPSESMAEPMAEPMAKAMAEPMAEAKSEYTSPPATPADRFDADPQEAEFSVVRERGQLTADAPIDMLGQTEHLPPTRTHRGATVVMELETAGGMPAVPGSVAPAPQFLGAVANTVHDLYAQAIDEGRGPGIAGDRFDLITDNPFQRVKEHPLSTFSIDVDTASYSKVRDFLVRANQLPRPDAVRIEELINYFDYEYAPPASDGEHPFAVHHEIVACPWNKSHRLARIALQGKTLEQEQRPPCNLVFLLDTSGSMDAPNKLPLVQSGMKMLLSQLGEKDRVAIVVYAGSAGLVLDSTPASNAEEIRRALTRLSAGGSTNGGDGISLAYQTARDHFITDGVNRVILCTDGDFNVGTTGTDELIRTVEKEAQGGVFLTVLGFGMGNHNDAMLEQISGRGNGNYAFIDTENEARKVLVEQTNSTLVTIAKDVKLQVEFNPAEVGAYRLIGYENRVLAKEDFNDDRKDAGEVGAGHSVTVLYELVPAGTQPDAIGPEVDELKYQTLSRLTEAANSGETLTLKVRYKQPDGDTSTKIEFPAKDDGAAFDDADADLRFAAAVAGFGMKLRRSDYAGDWTLVDVQRVAENARGDDRFGLRAEFIELVRRAAQLAGAEGQGAEGQGAEGQGADQ